MRNERKGSVFWPVTIYDINNFKICGSITRKFVGQRIFETNFGASLNSLPSPLGIALCLNDTDVSDEPYNS
jgi:hypothetical protein